MISNRSLVWALSLAIAGCGGTSTADQSTPDQTSQVNAAKGESSSFSVAEHQLFEGGASENDVLAARNFVVPFAQSDQANCFSAANLKGAKMAPPQPSSDAPALTRVAIAVDGSGSMAGRIGSRTKLHRAREATLSFIDSLPAGVPASLLTFGQQGNNSESGKAKSCRAVNVLAPMSVDRTALRSAAGNVRAIGWTPLAEGLRAAQKQLGASSVPGEQVVYVVSDGIETCGGDPVAVAREINKGNTKAVVNIIGFGIPTGEAASLQAVASAGGGRFVNVTDDGGFDRAMTGFREQMRRSNNRVSAGLAMADNAISTGATASAVVQCTGQMIDRETQGALNSYDERAKRGEALPPRYQVVALLKERHDVLAARRDAHIKKLDARRDTANAAVEATRKVAQ